MESLLFVAVYVLLILWFAFWVIRLGVRYGVNDALRMNQDWLRSRVDQTSAGD